MAHSLLVPALAAAAGVLAVKKGWVPNPVTWVKDKLHPKKDLLGLPMSSDAPGASWAQRNMASGMYGVGQLGSPEDLAASQQAMMADLQRYQSAPPYGYAPPGYGPQGWGIPVYAEPMYGAVPYGFEWPQQAPGYGALPYPMQQSLAPVYGPGQAPPSSLPQGGMVAEWSNVR